MSVAAVQSHLQGSNGIEQIEIGPYLTKLGAGLASSMVGPKQDIEVVVTAGPGALRSSYAVSLGLIVTELIMNAVKYAFPKNRSAGVVQVTFEKAKTDWKLTVSDNGVGRTVTKSSPVSTGLGTALIAALAKQLEAQVSEVSTDQGLTVEVTRATFVSRLPNAALRGQSLERQ